MEDDVLRTIARLDGTPFPSTAQLASRWLSGRLPAIRRKIPDVDLETALRDVSEFVAALTAQGILRISDHPMAAGGSALAEGGRA